MKPNGIYNAMITKAELLFDGNLTSSITVTYDNVSYQAFGAYMLGSGAGPSACITDKGNYAGLWVVGVMSSAGVSDWQRVVGNAIRVRIVDGLINEIGHIIRDDCWFCPSAAFPEAGA